MYPEYRIRREERYEREEFEEPEEEEAFIQDRYYILFSKMNIRLNMLLTSLEELNKQILNLSDSVDNLEYRIKEAERNKNVLIANLIEGLLIGFSVFIISAFVGAIILNSSEWFLGLLGPFLAVVIFWSWKYKRRKPII